MPAASSGYEFQRLHGMGETLYDALLAEHPDAALPGLCAGRRSSRSARLSGAAPAGERRELVVRRRWRPIPRCRSRPFCSAPAKLDRRCAACARIRRFRCRAISTRRRGAIRRASNSATARALRHCSASIASEAAMPADAAPLVDGIAVTGIERAVTFADRRRADRPGARSATRRSRGRHGRGAEPAFADWSATAVRYPRRRARPCRRSDRGANAAA